VRALVVLCSIAAALMGCRSAGGPDAGACNYCQCECPVCGANETCISWDARMSNFHAACATLCKSTADCPQGAECLRVHSYPNPGLFSPPVCVSPTFPSSCTNYADPLGCDVDTCFGELDAGVLLKPRPTQPNGVCVFDEQQCPKGCVLGGLFSGVDHCR